MKPDIKCSPCKLDRWPMEPIINCGTGNVGRWPMETDINCCTGNVERWAPVETCHKSHFTDLKIIPKTSSYDPCYKVRYLLIRIGTVCQKWRWSDSDKPVFWLFSRPWSKRNHHFNESNQLTTLFPLKVGSNHCLLRSLKTAPWLLVQSSTRSTTTHLNMSVPMATKGPPSKWAVLIGSSSSVGLRCHTVNDIAGKSWLILQGKHFPILSSLKPF